MGLFDYEKLKSEIHPYKKSSDIGTNFLEYMSKNWNWVQENAQWLNPNDPVVSLLNRKVLKATKLREELYFIKCKCYKFDGSFNYFTFVVNEHTIYKRFKIYTSKTETVDYFFKGNTPLNEYIGYLQNPFNYRISIKFFNNESSFLKSVFDNLENNYDYKHYLEWDIRDGMIVKPINITHYNKRTWIYLLQTHNENNMNLDYKSSSSDAYYDDDFAKKYN